VKVQLQAFLTAAGEWPASRSSQFFPDAS